MAGLGTIYAEGPYSMEAVGDVRQGRAVKLVTAATKQVEECDAAGEAAYGLAIHDKSSGEQVSVQRQGRNEDAVCGAAIAAIGTDVTPDVEGRYVTAVTGNVIVGKALTTTTVADQKFTIQLDIAGNVVPA